MHELHSLLLLMFSKDFTHLQSKPLGGYSEEFEGNEFLALAGQGGFYPIKKQTLGKTIFLVTNAS